MILSASSGSIPVSRTSITAAQRRFQSDCPTGQDDAKTTPPLNTRCAGARARRALIALDVYRVAEKSGQPVTMSMVQRRIGELQAHRP